jgi:TolB protein
MPPPDTPEPEDEAMHVPDLQSEICEQVEEALQDSYLRLGNTLWEASSEVPYPRVIRTDPPEGRQVERDSEVTVVCSLGPMRAVPDVAEWHWEEAVEWLEGGCCPSLPFETRLEHEITGKPEEVDTVIWTDPPGGKEVEQGSLVTLYIGVAPIKVEVPPVENMTAEQALEKLETSHLDVGKIVTETSESIATDRVIRSEPPSGEMVEPGTDITLVVSRGSKLILIPNVIDWTREAAEVQLESLGLQVTQVDQQYHDDILEGNIIETDPYAEEAVLPGQEIKLVVSLGLDPEGDRDNDGMPNGWEGDFGLDPMFDDATEDRDSDGLTNLAEFENETNPRQPDSDSDGFRDGEDKEPRQPLGGGSGWIAFVSERDGNEEIYLMKADGSEQTNLTKNPADDSYPAWSPDGKRLAFISNRGGRKAVWWMNADGSGVSEAWGAPDTTCCCPTWDPNGNIVAFSTHTLPSTYEDHWQVHLLTAVGTGLISDGPGGDYEPAFSGNGNQLAFTFIPGPMGNYVYVMNIDGSARRKLTENFSNEPAWSPDGRWIAFSAFRDNDWEIYRMKASGGSETNLTNHPASDNNAAWSPDSKLIAFDTDRGGQREIHLMNSDGGEPSNQIKEPAYGWNPAWQPAVSP